MANEAYIKQLEGVTSLDQLKAESFSFMVGRPVKDVAKIAKIAGAAERGHYGDGGSSYCSILNKYGKNREEQGKRFSDGVFNVLFGYDSGGNAGVEDLNTSSYPYFYFDGEQFVSGTLIGKEKWAPGYKGLLRKGR